MLPAMHRNSITVDLEAASRTLLWTCVVLIGATVALDLIFNWADVAGVRSIRRIFNMAREESLPTWFATFQATLVSVGAFAAWWFRKRRLPAGQAGNGLLFVSAFFMYVGLDDAAKIHERVGSASGRWFEESDSLAWIVESFPSYGWQLFVAPILAVCLLVSVAIVWRRSRGLDARPFLLATLLLFGLSQGIDFLEGIDELFEFVATRNGLDDYTVSHGFKVVEETLEMLATTAMLAAVLRVLVDASGGAVIRIDGPAPADVDQDITQPFDD